MVGENREIKHSLPIHYSQNYLINTSLIYRLIHQSSIRTNDEVLDIGAGKGIITKALLNLGCRVKDLQTINRIKEKTWHNKLSNFCNNIW